MKKICIILFAALLMLSICIPTFASSDKILVKDDADLLSDYEQSILHQRATQISNDYQIEVILYTTTTTNGMIVSDFAESYYIQNGYGFGEEHSGILLLIVMDYPNGGDWYIYSHNGGYDVLPPDSNDSLMEDVIPLLSDAQYNDAFHLYFDHVEAQIVDYQELSLDEVLFIMAIAVAIGAIAGLITVLIMRTGMKTAVFQHGAKEYIVKDSYDLKNTQDIFLYSHVTKVRRSKDSNSGRSSSGRSGGSGGRF